MTSVKLDEELLDGVEQFIADRDAPPAGKMSYEDAVNVIVRDWLMGQGYIPLSDEPDEIMPALEAARVPR
ncbi:hypothetical protein ABIB57_000939 [Devosia sp. UYZn731]|uniref:hypothetical protein n=1 Tax=Devosia sp. UYZn731 TaxID=3156345 RepID=UPI003399E960